MRGGFRGMFRFGCGSAYSGSSNCAFPVSRHSQNIDGNDFRSYLYSVTSQTSEPRQKADNMVRPTENEIYPGVRVGEQSFDVAVLLVGFIVLLATLIGACYLLGWISDCKAKVQMQNQIQIHQQMQSSRQQMQYVPSYNYTYRYYVAPTTTLVPSTVPQYLYAQPVPLRTVSGGMASQQYGRPLKVDW